MIDRHLHTPAIPMITSRFPLAFTTLCTLALCACRGSEPAVTATAAVATPTPPAIEWPRVDSSVPRDPRIEARITQLLGQLTLEQKVAQMVQPDIRWVTPEDVRKYKLGSVLNGGGGWPANKKHSTVADWVRLADRYYDASMDPSGGGPAIHAGSDRGCCRRRSGNGFAEDTSSSRENRARFELQEEWDHPEGSRGQPGLQR